MNLIDTHVHLDHVQDVSVELKEAAGTGVRAVVAVGVDLASNKIHLELQDKHNELKILLAFGIHPGNIIEEQVKQTFMFISKNKERAVAIGEIGLDYWYPWAKKSEEKKQQQRDVFEHQLNLAKEFDLPVVIHSRGAWKDCLRMTRAAGIRRAVFHWYSGPKDVLEQLLSCGYFISATPALFYSPQAQEAVAFAPVEQTLIETDTPVCYRLNDEKSFKAGPKDVFFTLEVYARLKAMDQEKAANILNDNAQKIFNFVL